MAHTHVQNASTYLLFQSSCGLMGFIHKGWLVFRKQIEQEGSKLSEIDHVLYARSENYSRLLNYFL